MTSTYTQKLKGSCCCGQTDANSRKPNSSDSEVAFNGQRLNFGTCQGIAKTLRAKFAISSSPPDRGYSSFADGNQYQEIVIFVSLNEQGRGRVECIVAKPPPASTDTMSQLGN
jgi:hypothetical protein